MSDIVVTNVIDRDKFYQRIESLSEEHDISYMEAVIMFCDQSGVEIEVAATLIKSNMRILSAIQEEGEALNFLPKTSRLKF